MARCQASTGSSNGGTTITITGTNFIAGTNSGTGFGVTVGTSFTFITSSNSLLGTSVAAVNSALQRARATLAALPDTARPRNVAADQAPLLARYVSAFERYDMSSLVSLPGQGGLPGTGPSNDETYER